MKDDGRRERADEGRALFAALMGSIRELDAHVVTLAQVVGLLVEQQAQEAKLRAVELRQVHELNERLARLTAALEATPAIPATPAGAPRNPVEAIGGAMFDGINGALRGLNGALGGRRR